MCPAYVLVLSILEWHLLHIFLGQKILICFHIPRTIKEIDVTEEHVTALKNAYINKYASCVIYKWYQQ